MQDLVSSCLEIFRFIFNTVVAGSLDHETKDAENFAAWGVDFLKYDNCYHMGRMGTPQISFNRFKVMADALKATGKEIALSLCNWGEDYVHTVSPTCIFSKTNYS